MNLTGIKRRNYKITYLNTDYHSVDIRSSHCHGGEGN